MASLGGMGDGLAKKELPSYSSHALEFLRVNAGETGVEWASPAGAGTVLTVVAQSPLTGGTITVSGTIGLGIVPVSLGGTSASTAAGARSNLLPAYAGNATKVLAVNAGETDSEWVAAGAGSGTVVTIVAKSPLLGGTITVSGTIALPDILPLSAGGTSASTAAGARLQLLPGFGSNATKSLVVNAGETDVEFSDRIRTVVAQTPLTGGTITVSGTIGLGIVPVSLGGTSASTASGARIQLLPAYSGNALQYLQVNAGETDVDFVDAVRTVVAQSPLTGGTITVSGTIGLGIVPVSLGGTSASTAAGARLNLLPSFTGNATKSLVINAGETDVEFSDRVRTVVAQSPLTGGTITVSGTIALPTILPLSVGGTSASTASDARIQLLPSYAGNGRYILALNTAAGDTVWFDNRDTLFTFLPRENQPTTVNYAVQDTRNNHPLLMFTSTSDWEAVFTGVMPKRYIGTGVNLYIKWVASAVTGNVAWNAAWERVQAQDIDSDSFAAASATAGAANGTSGILTESTISFGDGASMDSIVAGDLVRLKVVRAGSSSTDTMAGRAGILAIEVRQN